MKKLNYNYKRVEAQKAIEKDGHLHFKIGLNQAVKVTPTLGFFDILLRFFGGLFR